MAAGRTDKYTCSKPRLSKHPFSDWWQLLPRMQNIGTNENKIHLRISLIVNDN